MQFPLKALPATGFWASRRARGGWRFKRAALFPSLAVVVGLGCSLWESYLPEVLSPNTCSFTTQFSINTLQLRLWWSQGLFMHSRPLCMQRRADIYRYISSYVCSSQFVKQLHNTACPRSQLASCVLIRGPNRLVIQFKAKIITPPQPSTVFHY